jgi:tripartite-type tricarboxylate transporter receptor subunit TctC
LRQSGRYTLSAGIWSTHVVNGAVYKLSYDVLNDFAPVALLTDSAQIIVARKSMPANDLRELIAWLKANPDKALAGIAGVGSPQHIFGIFFQKSTDTRFGFAHYRGGAPAMEDLVADRIDLIIGDQVTSLAQIRGAPSKPMRSPPRHGWPRPLTFQQWMKWVCPRSILRCGTRFGRPKERQRR